MWRIVGFVVFFLKWVLACLAVPDVTVWDVGALKPEKEKYMQSNEFLLQSIKFFDFSIGKVFKIRDWYFAKLAIQKGLQFAQRPEETVEIIAYGQSWSNLRLHWSWFQVSHGVKFLS